MIPFIIASQTVNGVAGDESLLNGEPETMLNPFQNADLDISLDQLKQEEILDLLERRLKHKLRDQREPKMVFEEYTEQDIAESCATYSSIECGEQVLKVLGDSAASIQKKCKVRKEFLECIDYQRRTCKELANNKLFPVLPPKKTIRETQEKVWRALWTSGGCVLAV